MALARCEFDATDEAGNVLANVSVEVRRESDNALIPVYSDRAGTTPLGNPFIVTDGKVAFHAAGGAYKVALTSGAYARTRRYVQVGTAQELDYTAVGGSLLNAPTEAAGREALGLDAGSSPQFTAIRVGQVVFPASQVPSADANTLDDYEEGTFTPTVVGSGVAGTGTYSFQSGSYTKIGNCVIVNMRCIWSAHTGVGTMRMSGLPFASNGTAALFLAFSNLTYINEVMAIIPNGQAYGEVREAASGGAVAGLAIDTAADVQLSGFYFV